MTDSWRVIGFFGTCERDVIPKVLGAAVLDPTESLVVYSDLAESEDELRAAESMSREDFQRAIILGEAMPLPCVIWEPGAVLLLVDGKLERVSVWEAERRMVAFVKARRKAARAALARGDHDAALELFDQARRVSSEPQDIRQVIALTSDAEVRALFEQQLRLAI